MTAVAAAPGRSTPTRSTVKKALVTGATSGIGRATAVQLAREGFEVVVHGRDPERGGETVREIEKAGGKATFVRAELTDAADVQRLAEQYGDVDVLVNNSGGAWFGPSDQLDAERYDAMFDGNVRATYFLTAAIAPKMAARGTGSIVNVGSVAGSVGLAGGAAYGATKAALHALTRSWAAEYAEVIAFLASPRSSYVTGAIVAADGGRGAI